MRQPNGFYLNHVWEWMLADWQVVVKEVDRVECLGGIECINEIRVYRPGDMMFLAPLEAIALRDMLTSSSKAVNRTPLEPREGQ